MEYIVDNSADLKSYLKIANGGDQILLEEGDYSSVKMVDLSFDTPVVVRSADPDKPVEFNGKIILSNIEGLTFKGIDFVQADEAGFGVNPRIAISSSKNITLSEVKIEGRIPGVGEGTPTEGVTYENSSWNQVIEGYGYGRGLSISYSENIQIDRIDISKFRTGIGIINSDDVSVFESHIHQMSSDGIDFEAVNNLKIQSNLFDNFHPFTNVYNDAFNASAHSDFIQYWATGVRRGIDGVEISGNVMLQGEGGSTQAIFGRMDARRTGSDYVQLENFSIHDNFINTYHLNGITIGDVDGLDVYNNTVLPAPKDTGLPSFVPGYPQIRITTDLRVNPEGGYYPGYGRLPSDTYVRDNIVVSTGGGDGIYVRLNTPQEFTEQNVVIGRNAVFSSNPAHSNYWVKFFPELENDVASDVSDLIGLDYGGVRTLSPWLLDAVVKSASSSPYSVIKGGDGNDTLYAAETGSRVDGEAGDDLLVGGAGVDTLIGGAGNDTLSGGARGDLFSIVVEDHRGVEVDTILDLDFEGGDVIAFTEGFPGRFFSDSLDKDNPLQVFGPGVDAVLNSDADIDELVLSDRVSRTENANGDVDLNFDIDGNGRTDYILRLHEYARDPGNRTDVIIDGPPAVEPGVDEPADRFRFHAADTPGGHDFDLSELAFGEGDVLVLTLATPLAAAQQAEAQELGFSDNGASVEVAGISGLFELVQLGYARFSQKDGAAELVLDFEKDGIAESSARLALPVAMAADLKSLIDAAYVAPEDMALAVPDFEAGDVLLLEGFPDGYFDGIGDIAEDSGASARIDSMEDLALLSRQSFVNASRDGAGSVSLDFDLGLESQSEPFSLSLNNLRLADVHLITTGKAPTVEGTASFDFYFLRPDDFAGTQDRLIDYDFSDRDMLIMAGFEDGEFAGAGNSGSRYYLFSEEYLSRLDQAEAFTVGRAADGVSITWEHGAGTTAIDLMLSEKDLATIDGGLFS